MLANLNATHITDDERAYLAELQAPVVVFTRFLQRKYGINVQSFNAENGQITRVNWKPPEPIEPSEKSPLAAVPGDSNS